MCTLSQGTDRMLKVFWDESISEYLEWRDSVWKKELLYVETIV